MNNKIKNNLEDLEDKFRLALKLAIRNVFANRRRNIVIFGVFVIVVAFLYLFLAFGDGAVYNFRNGFQGLDNPRSDIMATKKGYANLYKTDSNSDKLKDLTIENYDDIRESLLKMDYIKDVYAKTIPVKLDLFINNSKFKDLSFRGVDESMTNYLLSKINIVEGSLIKPEDENVLLLNDVNKSNLKVEVGDKITVLGSDLFNNIITEDFEVVGYYKPKIDTPFFTTIAFTDIKGFNAISGYLDTEINYLNINLKKGRSIESTLKELNLWAIDKKLDIEFNEFSKIFVQDDEKYGAGRKMFNIITYLVIFFVMIGVINMILINLYDRRKEIGTYYCVGAGESLLMAVYTFELLIINISATIFGSIIGLGLQTLINTLKISSTNPGIQIAFGGSVFYMAFKFSTIVALFISVVIITLMVSLVALRSSLKVSPIAALHETEE